MALNKTTLAAAIVSFMQELRNYDNTSGKTSDDAMAKFANDLASVIDSYVKQGEVTVKIATADIGLQTSTGIGTPTGPPAVTKTLTTKGTIS